MAKIKTQTDFATLYFSPECAEWRQSKLGGQTSINHAERYCFFEQEEDATLFKTRWEGKGYTSVLD
jgi:hypothetical protein